MHLDHINLYVSDVARSRQFYEVLLPPHRYVVNREFEDIAVGFGDQNYAVLALVKQKGPIRCKTKISWIDRVEPTFSSNNSPKDTQDQ